MNRFIVDNYGNTFDYIDSLKTTALGSYPALSFWNGMLDYTLEYFYCSNEIFIDGEADNDYWTEERVKAIEARLAKTDNEDTDKVDLEAAIDIMFEEMANYCRYMMGK